MLVHWMSFWEPCFHSLWICPSLCFSGHVICSLAVLLFLLLTPLRTLTSCRPHVDLWPTSLSFFSLRLVVHFSLFFVLLKTPPFLRVRSVTSTLHTDCVLSTHWEGGGDPCSLSLFLSFDHHPLIYSSSPVAALLFSFSHSVLYLSSHPFFPTPCLSACARGWFHCHHPPCVCMETLGWRAEVKLARDDDLNTALASNSAWPTDIILCMACTLSMTLQSVSVPPLIYLWGLKKVTNLFGELWLVFALFMYECCGCFVCCHWSLVNCVILMDYLCEIHVFSVHDVQGLIWIPVSHNVLMLPCVCISVSDLMCVLIFVL